MKMTIRNLETSWVLLGCLALGVVTGCGGSEKNNSHGEPGGGGGGGQTSTSVGQGGSGGNSGGAGGTSIVAIENPCGASDPSLAKLDADALFGASKIPTFDVYLPKDSWQWLNDHAVDEQYVQAQACYNGKAIGLVGLRFKGSYGSLFNCFDADGKNTCRKLGMKISFDEYTDNQRFYGFKKLNFQGYRYDNTYMKERLAYDLYREMGIVAPRAAWALLRVNDEAQGLFGMVEQIDGIFTKDRWPDNGENNLFKEAWPGRSDDAWSKSHLETNKKEPNVAAFQAFSDAMSSASDDELRATLGQYVDLKYLARFMAADDAVASFDGVTTFYSSGSADESGNHNFFLYQESDHKFTFVPWDEESTMSLSSGYGNVPPWFTTPEDCSLTYSVWGGPGKVMAPGCDHVFKALAADLTDYKAAVQELLDGAFTTKAMADKIDELAAFIRDEATADPHGPGATAFENDVGFMKQEINKLRARLEHYLTGKPTVPVVLDVAQSNGFETADDYGLTAGTMLMSNANSSASVEVNATDPIAGSQSIRFQFDFGNETKAWNQWAFYALPFVTVPADLSGFKGIRVTLRSNADRTVRFDLKSPKNSGTNDGIQVGWDVAVTTTAKAIEVTLADAKVPSWATDPKDDLQGILKTVTALSFQPGCNGRNASGQLPDGVTDKGWLDIDAIELF
jgi:spore coat protein CotH